MTTHSAVTLFSGGGLSALGARQAGYDLVGAVEYDEKIAAVYSDNLGGHVTVGKVEDVSPAPYIGIDALLASPVCTRMSIANAGRGETDVDRIAAEGVCRWLRVARPKAFVMENVTQYRDSDSYRRVMATLYKLGYLCTDDTVNSADYGVPQTRKRMIVRALLGEMPPKLTPTHYNPKAASTDGGLFEEDTRGLLPWVGWYAAIEDILDTLPASKFAPWQLKRLDKGLDIFNETLLVANKRNSIVHCPNNQDTDTRIQTKRTDEPAMTVKTQMSWRALIMKRQPYGVLIEGDAAGERPPTCGTSAEPAFTLKTAGGGRVHRAFLCSDFTEASGQRVGIRYADAPSATIRAGANGGSVAKAFLVESKNSNQQRGDGLRAAHEPATTVVTDHKASHQPKGWLEQGRIVSMTPRALARFQSLPDSYALPPSNSLASTIIGNGVPVKLSEVIMRQLRETL